MKKIKEILDHFNFLKFPASNTDLDIEFLKREKYYNFQLQNYYSSLFGFNHLKSNHYIKKLLEVYNEWDRILSDLNINYYLAIWIYDSRIEYSEVVCGIDYKIDYYLSDSMVNLNYIPNKHKSYKNELSKFVWSKKMDLEPTFEWEISLADNRNFNGKYYYSDNNTLRILSENPFQVFDNKEGRIYYKKMGDIWVGRK